MAYDFSNLEALYQTGLRHNLSLIPQITMSTLTDACDYNRAYSGEGKYFNADFMDDFEYQDQDARIPEPVYSEAGKERRVGGFKGANIAKVFENIDALREGASDPASMLVKGCQNARERRERKAILAAIFGNGLRYSEDDNTTTAVPLPSEQKILVGFDQLHDGESPTAVSTEYPMTFGKFLEANRLLDDANIPSEDRILVISSYQLQQMSLSNTATSSYYAQNLKAILAGETSMFGNGVTVKKITGKGEANFGLPHTGTVEKAALYHKSAIVYRAREIKTLRIKELETKGYRPGIYAEFEQGATRMLDTAVIEIGCYRPA